MSIKKHKLKASDIVLRAKKVLDVKKNQDLADDMGVENQTISNWGKRNTIPWMGLFEFSQRHNVSLNYLLTGEKLNPEQETSCRDEMLEYKEKYLNTKEEVLKLRQFIDKFSMEDGIRKCDKEAKQLLKKNRT